MLKYLINLLGKFGWRTWATTIALGVAINVSSALPAAAAKKASPSFFNSMETKSTNFRPFKKWTKAVKRYVKEKSRMEGSCDDPKLNKCSYNMWMKFLDGLKGQNKMDQITKVNSFFNRAKYLTDQRNYSRKDYWASPGEFFAKSGDCEDYAISKFLSLQMLGFGPEEIRVVAVKDLNLRVGHAVLVVLLEDGTYLLDNQIKQVVETSTVRHYQPVFSLGSKAWWRHRK
jgi:predicted transglutaminase-like cysteine proteinase